MVGPYLKPSHIHLMRHNGQLVPCCYAPLGRGDLKNGRSQPMTPPTTGPKMTPYRANGKNTLAAEAVVECLLSNFDKFTEYSNSVVK
jgi:hypothetical protein